MDLLILCTQRKPDQSSTNLANSQALLDCIARLSQIRENNGITN